MTMHREKITETILLWLSFAATLTVLCGLIHLAVQQDLRQSANDPQIQMAEDAASKLAAGVSPEMIVPQNTSVDIVSSLSPYLMVFNDAGQPIAGSGILNGQPLMPPPGVFDYAKSHGEDRITWQPQPYVRQAAVIMHYAGAQTTGFVMAGRSLREVEIRENQLEFEVGAAWIFGLFITLITTAIYIYKKELIGRFSSRQ